MRFPYYDSACNSDLIDFIVQTSSIGGIFRAKTKGFREEQTIRIDTVTASPMLNTSQINTLLQSDLPTLPTNDA